MAARTADHNRSAEQLVRDLLSGHPEAPALLGEASHWQVLAQQSTAGAARQDQALAAARLAFEDLRRRLDPRAERPLTSATGAVLVSGTAVLLTALSWVDLAGSLTGRTLLAMAAATAAVWLGGAGVAVVARPGPGSWTARGLVGTGAVMMALLAALRWLGGPISVLGSWSQAGVAAIAVGLLCAGLSFALALAATVLMTRTEPLALAPARRRLRRAAAVQLAAARRRDADAQAAAVARQAWLGLVQAHAAGGAPSAEDNDAPGSPTVTNAAATVGDLSGSAAAVAASLI